VGLERQRTRISMDLHDEVGSGLASVGILSGVLAADGVSVAEARIAAGERRYLIFMRGVRTGAD
jgi:signal transduction histidine kinase